MNDRDCENCKHHTEKGCDSWDCKFERRMTREEAIEHAKEQLEIFGGEHREFIELAIKALEQEPKTGRWIAQDIHNCHTNFKCSECGYIHSFMHLYGKPTADYTYCPKCGAKMAESEE